jgi:hypothetical protein
MARTAWAFAALLCVLPSATASLSPPKQPAGLGANPPRDLPKKEATARGQPDEFQITDQTEVLLNGRPCRYEAVPASASIILMEVASENRKLVLKIHFRTKK